MCIFCPPRAPRRAPGPGPSPGAPKWGLRRVPGQGSPGVAVAPQLRSPPGPASRGSAARRVQPPVPLARGPSPPQARQGVRSVQVPSALARAWDWCLPGALRAGLDFSRGRETGVLCRRGHEAGVPRSSPRLRPPHSLKRGTPRPLQLGPLAPPIVRGLVPPEVTRCFHPARSRTEHRHPDLLDPPLVDNRNASGGTCPHRYLGVAPT